MLEQEKFHNPEDDSQETVEQEEMSDQLRQMAEDVESEEEIPLKPLSVEEIKSNAEESGKRERERRREERKDRVREERQQQKEEGLKRLEADINNRKNKLAAVLGISREELDNTPKEGSRLSRAQIKAWKKWQKEMKGNKK